MESPLPLPMNLHPMARAEYDYQTSMAEILKIGASLGHFAESKHQFALISADLVCKTFAFWYGRDAKGKTGDFTLTLIQL